MPLTDLIISEYVEGSSNNKAIELYNGTGSPIDLGTGGYKLEFFFNGSNSAGTTINLTGTIADGDVFVVADDNANAAILDEADLTSASSFFNGDDAIVLSSSGGVVDSIGQVGFDPGSEWGSGDTSTQNNTIRRLDTVTAGDTNPNDAFDPATEWEGFAEDTFDGLGTFSGSSGGSSNTPVKIYEIQGAAHTSPLLGQAVQTTGIVTAVDNNGFYLQDATGDGDIATSDAIFVFTGSAPTVSVGDDITIDGTVSEFTPGGSGTRNLSTTQISGVTSTVVNSSGNALPAAVIIGSAGRVPPNQNIDDDAFAIFDPVNDGIDFFESLEGMRVTSTDLVAVAGTNQFGEIFAVANQGANATGLSSRGTLNISPDDFNPEKIQIDADDTVSGFEVPNVKTGDFLGDVTGVIGYSFGNFEIIPTANFSAQVVDNGLTAETTVLAGTADRVTIASYNVLNLETNDSDGDADVADGRFAAIAAQIVNNLGTPDIIGLQEIQDNSGATNDGTVAADVTLQALVDGIAAAGGPTYTFIDNTFITNNASGGQPGGNIRTAFLYNPNRVSLNAGSVQTIGGQGSGESFEDARLPLVATFNFNGEDVTVVNNHFSSKGGSAPILGVEQDFAARQEEVTVNGSLDERQAQAAAVKSFVEPRIANGDNVVVLGDFNEFEFVSPLTTFGGAGLTNLTNTLPEDERYSFNFQGNSQSLDHILVSNNLSASAQFDIVHVNSEFAATGDRASDHDPLLVTLNLNQTMADFTLELFHVTDQEPLNAGGSLSDITGLSAVLNALRNQDLGNDGLVDNTLLLSSGDAIIPGLFYDASEAVFGSAGIADIQIQNELGIAAIALGNHEFDNGTAELAGLIDGSAPGDFSALTGTALDGQDFAGTAFPYLSANLDFSTDANLAPLEVAGGQAPQARTVTSSTVINVNGESIGVVGATTPTLASISSPGGVGISPTPFDSNPTEAQLDALAAEIQAEVDALLAANAGMNKVVLLSHMQRITIEQALAARLENVDIIVAGGSNTRLFDANDRIRDGDSNQGQYPQFITNAGGTQTALVNTDGSYKYLGRLVIDFDAAGNIIPESYDATISGAYATDAQGVADLSAAGLVDPEIQAIVDAIEAEIIATEGNVFGLSNVFLNGNRSGTGTADDPDGVRTQETNLGNLTADANLAIAKETDPTVVISIKNGGGIRASIGETVVPPGATEAIRRANGEVLDSNGNVVKPEGGISQNDIATALAFNNDLVLLTLTKQEIIDLLEFGVAALPGVSGRFPQVAGVKFSFDPDQAEGSQIQNAAIFDDNDVLVTELVSNGQIVGNPDETFRVVTLGFLASPRFDAGGNFTGAGDGYPFPNLNENAGVGAVGDPAVIARVNLVSLEQAGVQTGDATFADNGTEQDALAEYLFDNFATAETAFNQAEVGPAEDERIQNLSFREDTVLLSGFDPNEPGDEGLFQVATDGDTDVRIKISIEENSVRTLSASEIVIFQVDDTDGSVNGVAKEDAGYLDAILAKGELFTALNLLQTEANPSGLPEGFDVDGFSALLPGLGDNTLFGFMLINGGTLDELEAGIERSVSFSNLQGFQVSNFTTGRFDLSFDAAGVSFALDVAAVLETGGSADPAQPGTGLQSQIEVLDLRDFDSLTGQITVFSEAAFDNTVGFYRTDENGNILSASGDILASIGDANYINVMIAQAQTLNIEIDRNTSASFLFEGGGILAPFIIANGDFGNFNVEEVFTPFIGANADGVDHVRMFGDNVFGFEDLAGGGDRDFDDIIIEIDFA